MTPTATLTHHRWDYPDKAGRWYRQDWDAKTDGLPPCASDSYNLLVQFSYDADGNRIRKVANGQTTIYVGNTYEKNLTTGIETKYYYLGGQRIAMRQGTTTAATVTYLHSDHLGSASLTTSDTRVKGLSCATSRSGRCAGWVGRCRRIAGSAATSTTAWGCWTMALGCIRRSPAGL